MILATPVYEPPSINIQGMPCLEWGGICFRSQIATGLCATFKPYVSFVLASRCSLQVVKVNGEVRHGSYVTAGIEDSRYGVQGDCSRAGAWYTNLVLRSCMIVGKGGHGL